MFGFQTDVQGQCCSQKYAIQLYPTVLEAIIARRCYQSHTTMIPVLESLFNKVAGLKACNFIEKRLQHRSHKTEPLLLNFPFERYHF